MLAKRTIWIGSVGALLAAVGCATGTKERMALLEETNSHLTARLNMASTELEKVRQDQEYLDGRLHAAMNEAQDLREQLAMKSDVQQAPPGWTAVPGGAMIALEGDVLFAPGQAVLQDQARRSLDAIVSVVQGEYLDRDVLVLGHTDDQPIKKSGWKDNAQLSTERSLAVMRYLRDQGVAPARLMAAGCGEYRPRVAGTSASDRAANRRVEFFALQPLAPGAGP